MYHLSLSVFLSLLGSINNVPPRNLALVHQVINLLQLRHTDDLEGGLDDATTEEFDGLGAVLAVADV